jgi:hypothetical protein
MIRRLIDAAKGFARLRLVSRDVSSMREDLALNNRLLANAERDRLLAAPENAAAGRLERFGFKGFSQNDEDGIICEIFRRIGTTDKRFVEFGTGDGLENNTAYLLCQGWTGLWIDGAKANCEAQRKNFGWAIDKQQLKSVQDFLTVDNINQIFSDAGVEGELDLLSVDVDGNDYHLWKAITVVQPRVVVIEYNAYVRPPVRWVMQYKPNYVWDGESTYFNSSLESLARLGEEKGYTLVGCNLCGLNAFFVRKDLVADQFCADASAATLFQPRRWWINAAYNNGQIPFDRPFIQ